MNAEEFKLLAENSSDVISRHSPDGNYLYASPSSLRLLGYTPEELLGRSVFELFHPDDMERIQKAHHKKVETLEAETTSYRILTKENGFQWVETVSRLITDKRTGEPIEIHAITRDISQRVELEKKLEEERQLLTQLFENSPTATVKINNEREILDVNRSFELTFGYSREESIGTNIKDLITPDHLREESPPANKNPKRQFESVRHHQDGNLLPVLIGVNPVYSAGKLIAKYISYVDISERKRHEDAMRVSLQEKSVLLQEVHHRVKNNLALVSGLLNLQKHSIENSELEQILTDCELQVKSISLIHEKLYESSNLSRINFAKYVEELFSTIQQVYDPGKEIQFRIDSRALRININQAIPVALILNELITNAYKYAFEGIEKKMISIAIREKRGRVELQLSDNGVGLPEDFDFEKSTKMGYTIISTLVRQLKANFEMNRDGGTCIRISFKKRNTQGPGGNLI